MNGDYSLHDLQEISLEAHTVIRDEAVSLFDRYGDKTPEITPTLNKLFAYLSSRNQTVSFLVSWGYVWDAEIILRSFYETASKILFICFSEEVDKLVLIEEFWNKLGSAGDRKRAQKAKYSSDIWQADSVTRAIFDALQDERLFDLEAKSNKIERKRIEQKWSFSGIIESLEGRMVNGKPLVGFKGLLHIYGMCSHLAHADSAALDMITDRAVRPDDELRILEASHISRILSDQVSLSWFCTEALRHHFNGKFSDERKFVEAFNMTLNLSEYFQHAFSDSQQEFYNQMRNKK